MGSTRSTSRENPARPTRAGAPADWLPQARPAQLMSDKRIKPFIESKMDHHWFLCFANALYGRQQEGNQGAIVAKAYAFLHDYMPDGFVGRWAAVRGNDVMDILLCDKKELSVTRHKATSSAQAAFENLEEWMRKGTSWGEAMSRAAAERKKAGHKRGPLLYSPAGLAALLILSYPDPRYRQWVGRLQIDWMLTRQGKFEVKEGFWKGITDGDLSFFHTEEPRRSEVPLAADYDLLFGQGFLRARQDIRPFVPELADDLSLTGVPSDSRGSSEEQRGTRGDREGHTNGKDADADSGAPSEGPSDPDGDQDEPNSGEDADADADEDPTPEEADANDEVAKLATLLRHDTSAGAAELRAWLAALLSDNDNDTAQLWCTHWAQRMEQARSYQEQVIVQSLLLRSLGVLHRVSSSASCAVSADAVMLLDIEDGRVRPRADDPQTNAARLRMRTLPACKPRVEAEERLMQRALDQGRRDILRTSFDGYLDFFSDLFMAVSKHRQNVLKLDTLRTEVVIRGAAEKSGDREPLDTGLVEALHLTRWQLRIFAVATLDTPGILTDQQERIRLGVSGRGKTHDLSQYKPVVAADNGPEDVDAGTREVLRKLLGDLNTPFAELHGDVSTASADRARAQACSPPQSQPPAACHIRTQSPASTSSKMPTPTTSGRARVNPYVGRSVKRACSPDTRNVKRLAIGKSSSPKEPPRLRGKQDAITSAITASKDEILEFVEDKVAELSKQSRKRLAKQKRHYENNVESLTNVLETRIGSLESKADEMSDMQETIRKVTTSLETIIGQLKELQETVSPPHGAGPGQEGYLTSRCPAPPGWDQKAYESVLLRAGWSYAAYCDLSEEGFAPDEEAFDFTLQKFPSVDSQHLVATLEHIHIQAYNRPYPQGEEQDLINGS